MQQLLGNKYEVLKQLGQGGMGEVFLVQDIHLNRPAAAKRIRRNRQGSEEFKREMELLKELEHPLLPAVYDFFKEQEWFYLIMEYVEGITLEQYLKKNKTVDAEQAVIWAVELTEVLGYLHNRKPAVIYCDLKPGNIMIKPGGELKLIDLGACRQGIRTGGVYEDFVGTKGYAPPEQWEWGGVTKCSDIYALGAVLHEMVTGISPLMPGYERRPVREYDRGIPVRLEKIIDKCTKEQAVYRYQTMESVKEALLHKSMAEQFVKAGWMAAGLLHVLLWGSVIFSLGWPLFQGVPETEIPFPYLYRPLLLGSAAVLFQRLLFQGKRRSVKKIEKSILATEKKFDGLLAVK